MLKRSFEALKQEKDRLMIQTRSGGTRWIGHQLAAIEHLLCSCKFIVSHLEQVLIIIFKTELTQIQTEQNYKSFIYSIGIYILHLIKSFYLFTPIVFYY